MDVFSVAIFAVVACVLAVLIKQYNPEIAILISLLTGVMIFLYIINETTSVFSQISYLISLTDENETNLKLLVKSLGICFITQMACDICEDSGQKAIGSKVELAGKIAILVLSLPLFSQLITLISRIVYR